MRVAAFIFAVALLSACYSAPPDNGPPPGFPPPSQSPIPGAQMCGGMMGGRCNNPNEFCQYFEQAQCGAADQSGVCSPRPQICTREYAPVCSCDGRTYPNACTAAGNGASVAYRGECRG